MSSARSHSLMHQINDDMRERRMAGRDEPIPFFCECSREDCFQPIWLTQTEYDLIVEHGMSVIIAGHEEVVSRGESPEPRSPQPTRAAATQLAGAAA